MVQNKNGSRNRPLAGLLVFVPKHMLICFYLEPSRRLRDRIQLSPRLPSATECLFVTSETSLPVKEHAFVLLSCVIRNMCVNVFCRGPYKQFYAQLTNGDGVFVFHDSGEWFSREITKFPYKQFCV